MTGVEDDWAGVRDRVFAVASGGFNPPFEPYVDACLERHTFQSWYLEWLERKEAEVTGRRVRRPSFT
ncbi:hypothetical protein [Actinospica robiniae]|uniref:hypothetical protein n=1 Tax=Actinospica robiniae TaxID=304901 RepID=UPI00040F106D|nr:hypothetical protein [Actinospica robiniae]